MKAISLTQPWATLVVTGEKKIETRSWRANYRGVLAVHASKGFPKEAKELIYQEPFKSALSKHHYLENNQLPTGAIIGLIRLEDCVTTNYIRLHDLTTKEFAFGDYSDNRWAWILSEAQQIKETECKGMLGLWTVPKDIEKQILMTKKFSS